MRGVVCAFLLCLVSIAGASVRDRGGLSPEEALAYMKMTDDIVIVDVAATKWYKREHFIGAVNIPIEELDSQQEDELYMNAIPSGRPVILHCRRGMIVPGAYRRVKELRSDIPEISYIAGTPKFAEYNEYKAGAEK